MKVLRENVRFVSGAYFRILDIPAFANESGEIAYMLYQKDETERVISIVKSIRMLSIPYRMILLTEGDRECCGVFLYGNDEQEELVSVMEWIAMTHPKWMVINCRKVTNTPKIIGYRITNNLFHAKKLALQGEISD